MPKMWMAWALDAEAAEIEAQEVARDLAEEKKSENVKPGKLLGGE